MTPEILLQDNILLMPFMQKAIIAGIIVGFLGSYYGVFLVQRKMSFMGDGLGHAAFGGVALGILLNTQPLTIAVPFTILVSLGIIYLREKTRLAADTAIGILFAVSGALGIIFLSLKSTYSVDAFSYLFGSILTVDSEDLIACSIVLLLTITTFFKLWHRWAYSTFDQDLALADRQPVVRDDYILTILTATTIVVSIKLVGIILIASFLVIPAAASRLVSQTYRQMTYISIAIGIFSSIAGLYLSFVLDLPSGAVIILVQALVFAVFMFWKKNGG
jgi:zinc transport system permease protein